MPLDVGFYKFYVYWLSHRARRKRQEKLQTKELYGETVHAEMKMKY